ncbi:TetR/AcrR family transcriptional regulator [Allosediminivita pacifica]|uniref:TetR family transcriptional regulator n=1 Tax=Allosediminivita pacifica TaxID=1267769 RepID=A0A2T6AJ57_9RHOB|nr:TetR/AcrR family transcriptional regulator [Allosediminivita pacifica]PTX43858.1 TetR family transcriptional regulator [Allosediminivita pacifica]GGB22332.1 TetR family transcriptional regulator [Allosediminivita pacifica]
MSSREGCTTRRRGAALETAILEAAWKVLRDQGYAGFTFEAIAARAGTSRPVLYRRWSGRQELLVATLRQLWQSKPIEIPDTGSLRGDALAFLMQADERRARIITLMSVELHEYFRETGSSFRELRAAIREPGQATALEVIVERAVARGEIADVARPARVVNLPFELFRQEVIMTMGAVPPEAIHEIVDEIWLPLLLQG